MCGFEAQTPYMQRMEASKSPRRTAENDVGSKFPIIKPIARVGGEKCEC